QTEQRGTVPLQDQAGDYGLSGEQNGNSTPAISQVKFVPEVFHPGDNLGVEVIGTDADGDDVVFTIEWTVNDEGAGNGNRCGVSLSRGDKVEVKITPFDGTDHGQSIKLKREIANIPPRIEADEVCYFDGNTFEYRVKASDPDGDRLTYSLQSAPAGMTIDPKTGLIKWTSPDDYTGLSLVSILVEDGHGGRSSYNLSLTIKTEEAAL
ncbi:MAG: Ig domain-containing protein, partial [Planctomycetota bacterium]